MNYTINETDYVSRLLEEAKRSLEEAPSQIAKAFWQARVDTLTHWDAFNKERRNGA